MFNRMFPKMANLSANLWLVTFVLVTIILFHQANAAPQSVNPKPDLGTRIVGGEIAKIEKLPYQVAVLIDEKRFCGGSILNENHVLTAAHCVGGPSPIRVSSGTDKIKVRSEIRKVTKKIPHPKYGKPLLNDDIAILKVEKPFQFSNTTKPIQLYDKSGINISKHVGRQIMFSGFGLTSYGGMHDNQLRYAYGEIMDTKKCNKMWVGQGFLPLSKECFCAVDKVSKQSVCDGDSGGPLVMDERILGIVSEGHECGRTGLPTVYTNVPYYAQWIKDNIK